MAFAFASENGFELGTRGHFDAEQDDEARLDFVHYAALAKIPGMPAPYRGAYCMRANLAHDGSPADAYVQETGSWDTAANNTIFHRLMFWVSPTITMANNDELAIFQLWSSTSTAEAGAYINYTTANGLRLGIGETSASQFLPLTTNVWHCLELKALIDPGANDGTLDAWLDGGAFTQVASLNQGDITSGVVGVIGQDAGTTAGVILFDEIVADDARIYPPSRRYPTEILLTASGHVFVGPGVVTSVSLLSGAGTDNVVALFDTDIGATNDASNIRLELKNTANNAREPWETPTTFSRGCYVSMSGTNPRAIVKIKKASGYFSDGAVRNVGHARVAHPLGA